MSPELESSYPNDKELREFKLEVRQRTKDPLTKVSLSAFGKDPFGFDH